jgi:hypothetical protein
LDSAGAALSFITFVTVSGHHVASPLLTVLLEVSVGISGYQRAGFLPMYAICPAHLILRDLIILIILDKRVQIMKILIKQFLLPCHYFISSLFGPDIRLSTLFSSTLSICSSLMTLAVKMGSAIYKILGELDLSEAPPCTKNLSTLSFYVLINIMLVLSETFFGKIKNKRGISGGKSYG